MKDTIKTILLRESDASIRFELLEKFYHHVDSEEDVRFLVTFLEHDPDPCVRHEAAAQLFRVEEKKPHLMANLRTRVVSVLLERALHDESTVVRHESIEALGYVADESALGCLEELSHDENLDIRSTADIAFKTASRRIKLGIKTGELSDRLVSDWRNSHAV